MYSLKTNSVEGNVAAVRTSLTALTNLMEREWIIHDVSAAKSEASEKLETYETAVSNKTDCEKAGTICETALKRARWLWLKRLHDDFVKLKEDWENVANKENETEETLDDQCLVLLKNTSAQNTKEYAVLNNKKNEIDEMKVRKTNISDEWSNSIDKERDDLLNEFTLVNPEKHSCPSSNMTDEDPSYWLVGTCSESTTGKFTCGDCCDDVTHRQCGTEEDGFGNDSSFQSDKCTLDFPPETETCQDDCSH